MNFKVKVMIHCTFCDFLIFLHFHFSGRSVTDLPQLRDYNLARLSNVTNVTYCLRFCIVTLSCMERLEISIEIEKFTRLSYVSQQSEVLTTLTLILVP